MGSRVGRSTLFGIPLQQQWSYGNSGEFAPTYYLQSDAPLYYYSFTDAFIASAYRSLGEGGAGALRSDDHRLQPGGHVCRRSHQARAEDLPRRLHRHRRIQHPQGIRVREDLRRDREPDQSGARSDPRFRRRERARRHPPQRHRHAVREDRCRAGVSRADEGAPQAAPAHAHHLGAHRPRPHRSSGAGVGRSGRAQSGAAPDRRGDGHRPGVQSRELRHFVGRGREVRRRHARVDRARRRDA